MGYWRVCIEEAFEDAQIEASDDQIDIVATWADGAHENYGLATGHDVASANLAGEKERTITELKKELQEELNKTTCETCGGRGYIRSDGPAHYTNHECYKCHGQGRL
ncbi:MAG: hypothetical protein ACUZ8E_12000 [Candidatus Anammoxibacter sp.]